LNLDRKEVMEMCGRNSLIIFGCILSLALIAAARVQTPAKNRVEKPSAAERLAIVIEKNGLDAAIKMFAELRKKPGDFSFSEQEFDELGERLINGQKYEAAAAVFNMNVELFPDSPFVYYSLAMACIYTGNKECAEKNFRIFNGKVPNPDAYHAGRILADIDSRLERVARERERPYRPGQQTGLKGPYLGQKPPGQTAEIFAPGLVSRALATNFSCTFSPDGREFYFNHFMTIMVCRWLDEGWTAPEPAGFHGDIRAHEPHITLDGRRLYFGWFQPTPEGFLKSSFDYGIYVCERTSQGWSEPRYVGEGMFVTSSRDGKIYVTEKKYEGDKEIYAHISQAILQDGHFTGYKQLGGGLINIQTDFPRTAHPSISPDGRTILFDSSMRSGLYAAFLDGSGVWSRPVRLSEHGLSESAGIADYSPDGKYIFFQDHGDIWWISSEFVERLRPGQQKATHEIK
jgi:tetratricopeptide (TPR) repeat protein